MPIRHVDRLFEIIRIRRAASQPVTAAAIAAEPEITVHTGMSRHCRRVASRSRAQPASGMGSARVRVAAADAPRTRPRPSRWGCACSRAPVTPACRRQPTSTIRYAIRAARKMRITYQDADGRGTERVIQPIAVAHYVGATLICAWCELRNDVRHFRADRVVTADVLDESFCTDVTAVGTRFFVQGFFRDGLDFQGLAVDTTGGRGLGNVYITWQDGRNLNQIDPFGFVGVGGTGGCPLAAPPGLATVLNRSPPNSASILARTDLSQEQAAVMTSFQPAAVSLVSRRVSGPAAVSTRREMASSGRSGSSPLSRASRSLGVVTMMLPVRATTHQYARPVKAEGFDCTAYAQVART